MAGEPRCVHPHVVTNWWSAFGDWKSITWYAGRSWTSDFSFMLLVPTAMAFVAWAAECSGGTFPVAPWEMHPQMARCLMCICLSVFQAARLHELRQYMFLFMYCIHLFISWHSLTSFNIHMHLCVCVRFFQLSYQYAFSSKIVSECFRMLRHSYVYVYICMYTIWYIYIYVHY